jgi:radical SAM superfamily enzyme YgiQ (UPF0313 family)
MRVLLVSTYELGHQPLHLASPAAALRDAGHEVRALDLAVEAWDTDTIGWADAVAFSVPMHTAMRLAQRAARAVREPRAAVPICFYGLYAAVGHDPTSPTAPDRVITGEYEPALVAWVDELAAGGAGRGDAVAHLGRTRFRLPARSLLPPLDRYARLAVSGETRVAGYVEASHGCAHRCRHCPVPVVYDGRIRIVDVDVVVDDVARLVAAGARHITFGDPDFLNGAQHSRRVVGAVHERFPALTFDCTTKVEHILRHAGVWPELAASGCIFVVSAFESVNDAVLERLDKGHRAADAAAAVALLRTHAIEIRPSFLPFTPWTSVGDVRALLEFVVAHDLIDNVDPVQYTIRLLLPEGSLLLDHPDLAPHLGVYDAGLLGYRWSAADPEVDALHARISAVVSRALESAEPIATTFGRVWREVTGADLDPARFPPPRPPSPRLTEPWFCCAEPTEAQLCCAEPTEAQLAGAP